jgi:hypothetical protein
MAEVKQITLPPVFLRQHLLHHKLSDVDIAIEVGFGQPPKIVRRVVGKRLREEDAGIGDYSINGAESGHRRLNNRRRG